MAEKRIEDIGRGQQSEMASRFLLLSLPFPDHRPKFPIETVSRPVVEWKMFVVPILRLNWAMTVVNQKFP
jgi:hypothetical protein